MKINNTLSGAIMENVSHLADKMAFISLEGDTEIKHSTYKALYQAALNSASFIKEHTRIGDRVLLMYTDKCSFLEGFLGCIFSGRIAVPVVPPFTSSAVEQLVSIYRNCEPSLILTDSSLKEKLDIINKIRILSFVKLEKLVLSRGGCPDNLLSIYPLMKNMHVIPENFSGDLQSDSIVISNPSDIAFLQYTSGSTGIPKGVKVSQKNILSNCRMICDSFHITRESIGAIWLPHFHDMGLIGGLLTPIYRGMTVYLLSPHDFIKNPLLWLKIISKYRVSISGGPNFAYQLCSKYSKAVKELDLSCWTVAFVGAEPVFPEVMQKFSDIFSAHGFNAKAIHPCYGLAENTLMVSSKPFYTDFKYKKFEPESFLTTTTPVETNAETCIKVSDCGLPVFPVKIISPTGNDEVIPNTIGEIAIAGASLSEGYWKDKSLPMENISASSPDDAEYFRTGDMGFIDSHGHLYVTGRHKDIIIINGRNLYAHDLEKVVCESSDAFRPGACIAFSVRGLHSEQLTVVAEIKKNCQNYKAQEKIVSSAIRAIARNYDVPVTRFVLVIPHSLPKTSSGKPKRYQVIDLLNNDKISIVYQWPEKSQHQKSYFNTIFKKIFRIKKTDILTAIHQEAENILGVTININDAGKTLSDFGFDSIMAISLVSALENRLSIVIDLNENLLHRTVRQLANDIAILSKNNDVATPVQDHSDTTDPVQCLSDIRIIKEFEERYHSSQTGNLRNLYFLPVESVKNATVTANGEVYDNYASYDYLGLSQHPEIIEFVSDQMKKYGTSASSSRVLSGDRTITCALEKSIAELIGVDDAIVLTAGYHTVSSVITHLFGKKDLIIHDKLAHNSTLMGAIQSGATTRYFEHNSPESLHNLIANCRHQFRNVLIVVEGIYSMDGDIAPLREIVEIKKKFNCFLMTDEAHSIGVLGNTGQGITGHLNILSTEVDIHMGTLSKALGSCGGYIAGKGELIRYLKFNMPGFVFSAGITPINAASALKSIEIMKKEPERLQRLQKLSTDLIAELKINNINTGMSRHTPIIPIIVGKSEPCIALSQRLFENNIYAPPILQPAVSEARIRLFITCLHTPDQFKKLISLLIENK